MFPVASLGGGGADRPGWQKRSSVSREKINWGDTAELPTKKGRQVFSGKNRGVTPSVAAPGVTHPSDATACSGGGWKHCWTVNDEQHPAPLRHSAIHGRSQDFLWGALFFLEKGDDIFWLSPSKHAKATRSVSYTHLTLPTNREV